jgi:hypothetical protein
MTKRFLRIFSVKTNYNIYNILQSISMHTVCIVCAVSVVLLCPTATLSRKSDSKDNLFKPQFQVN